MSTSSLFAILAAATFVFSIQTIASYAASSTDHFCIRSCGGISIPYPFWISDSRCGLPPYRVLCTNNSPFLVTDAAQFPLLQISPGSLLINTTTLKAESCNINELGILNFNLTRQLGPFALSGNNVFMVLGCGSNGSIIGSVYDPFERTQNHVIMDFNCEPGCSSAETSNVCTASCCIASVPAGVTQLQLTGGGAGPFSSDPTGQKCGYSAVFNPISYTDYNISVFGSGRYGMEIGWGIMLGDTSQNCSTVSKTTGYACAENSTCGDIGYIFNRTAYFCNCSEGFAGDGYKNGTGCSPIPAPAPAPASLLFPPSNSQMKRNLSIAILSTGISMAIFAFLLFSLLKSREVRRRKRKYFELHGGRRLQQLLPSLKGNWTPILFTESELEKATLKYSEKRRLGSGAYGTVYKGTLADGSVVAIKRSNRVQEPGEADRFVNEIILLSSINHRNIVRLLGCCLEAQVPVLVYEYVSNGAVSEHLQGKFEKSLSWDIRLQIALQIADALAYLHSAASPPIIHRDVKCSNVLLEENFEAKVVDFGVSRLLAPDQTHVSTAVQGTFGYLDPQYFETFQLTEKSDVYSFGVVLFELITSLSAVCVGGNLASLCLKKLRTEDFWKLADPHLNLSIGSPEMSSVNDVAELAERCVSEEGNRRPFMRDVAEQLRYIRFGNSKKERMWSFGKKNDTTVDDEEEKRILICTSPNATDAKLNDAATDDADEEEEIFQCLSKHYPNSSNY